MNGVSFAYCLLLLRVVIRRAPSILVTMCIHDMSRGTSRLVEFHASLYSTFRDTPRLVLLHIL